MTARHLQRFWLTRSAVVARPTLVQEVAQLRALFRQIDPPDLIHDDVRAWLAQRRPKGPTEPPSGYSDQEFEAIMAAARSDVVAIRQRLDSGRRLLARFARNPDSLDIEQQKLAGRSDGNRGHRRRPRHPDAPAEHGAARSGSDAGPGP
ncbi:hypothetical protein, partial [Actinoplanes nipponensis]|uniref:hypothetical protein n=1 Tax=Actinoplanes nipponensis TaxID=135950 RepID=UPI0031E9566B